jgi:ABC-2 type transport system ATP-binding protein
VLAIEAEGLTKQYRGRFGRPGPLALSGLDLRLPAGAAFGLIGPNGAGKTTFVKALLGVVHPTAGSVRLLGGDPQDPAVRARVGYLPERLELSRAWTPLEILASVSRAKRLGLPPAALLGRLEVVGLGREARRAVGGFSKGMKQRVGLAAALLGEPELLVLDEPTDGLDPLGRVEVRALLQAAVARGTTLLLNSHLLAETERVCGRIGVLVAGRIVREGPLETIGEAVGAGGPPSGPGQPEPPGPAAPRWRLRFADGAPAEALRAAGFTPGDAGAWRLAGDPAALNAALDAARAAGALILEVGREAADLEAVLAAAVEARS